MLSWIWSKNNKNDDLKNETPVNDDQKIIPTEVISLSRTDSFHKYAIQSILIAFDKYIITGSNSYIRVSKIDNAEITREISEPFDWVNDISIVHGSNPLLVTAHGDGIVRVFDFFDSTVPARELLAHSGSVLAIDVLQGPTPRIVSCGYDGTAIVWDSTSGEVLGTLIGHKHPILAMAVSHGPFSMAVTGDGGGVVIGWDLASYQAVGIRQASTSAVRSLAVADGDKPIVVVGRQDGTVQLYMLRSGHLIMTLQAHTEAVRSLSIYGSADNIGAALMLTGSSDVTLRLWSLSGDLIATLQQEGSEIYSTDLTQGGLSLRIVSGGADKVVRLWEIGEMSTKILLEAVKKHSVIFIEK